MISALIVDDEQDAIDTLIWLIDKCSPEVTVCATAPNIQKANKAIQKHQPDLIFLDINIAGESGMDFLESYEGDAKIVFTTAYSEFVFQALRLSAFDYLVKPIGQRELIECISRFQKNKDQYKKEEFKVLKEALPEASGKRMLVPCQGGYKAFHLDEFVYLEASGNYTKMHTRNGIFFASKAINEYEPLFCQSHFVRIHRTYIVNIHFISSIDKGRDGQVVLQGGQRLDVSRARRLELLNKFMK